VTRLARGLASLYSRASMGMRLGLESMQDACLRAGHPEASFGVVHVAGTNGKGSVCAMIEAMARAEGLRTGLYTSPHLLRFAERIRIHGSTMDDDALALALEEALELGPELSFFETATLSAFLAFRRAAVDLVVLEVGIGGRLDATNVVTAPRVTALTGVALDHQDKLGSTLDAIAREKAAIAKPRVPMVLGTLSEEARNAALEVAILRGARIVEAEPIPESASLSLSGAHQRANASVAWTVGRCLGLGREARLHGLATATWPGRLERLSPNAIVPNALVGPWLLDGAHNPDGARALVEAVSDESIGAVVFGALADKSWQEVLGLVAQVDAPRVYAPPKGRIPASPQELAALRDGEPMPDVASALARARALAGQRLVLVCGSLYLVGEARAQLLGLPTDPVVAL
jgi:dihydrofolate synthase/folylpolyglutamate synthase